MATRNKRKRRAKAKRKLLERAVQEAFRLEHERKIEAAKPTLEQEYPCKFGGVAGSQRLTERVGLIVSTKGKRKLVSREPKTFEPLKHDGNESGKGQLRKKYI